MPTYYYPGQPVIYRRTKHSARPGPRARNVQPTERGETYWYEVEKFWVVDQLQTDGTLILRTRRGKKYIAQASDPHLRPARWWERIVHRHRFPCAS